MHGVLDICLALALVFVAGADVLNVQPLAFLGGFLAAFHLVFHMSVGSLLVYRRVRK